MRWHYRLGHLTFAKLKQLALNGEIPKKLVKIKPPKCAGCLFGSMTKIPWRGKETKASHEVFIATKPGECVSVNQMASTEVGFFAQMKGKLTKRRYRGALELHDRGGYDVACRRRRTASQLCWLFFVPCEQSAPMCVLMHTGAMTAYIGYRRKALDKTRQPIASN